MSLLSKSFLLSKGDSLDQVSNYIEREIGLDSYLIRGLETVSVNSTVTQLTVLFNKYPDTIVESFAPREGSVFATGLVSNDFDVRFLFNYPVDFQSIASGTFILDGEYLDSSRVYPDPNSNNYYLKVSASGSSFQDESFHTYQIGAGLKRIDGSSFPYTPVGGYVFNTLSSAHIGDYTNNYAVRRRGRVSIGIVRLSKGINPQQGIAEYLTQRQLESDNLISYSILAKDNNLIDVYFLYISKLEPQIVSGFPLNNSLLPDISAPGKVTLVFNTKLDKAKLSSVDGLFTIESGFSVSTNVLASDVTLLDDLKTVEINTSSYFSAQKVYSIIARPGILALNGLAKEKPEQWTIHINKYESTGGGGGVFSGSFTGFTGTGPGLTSSNGIVNLVPDNQFITITGGLITVKDSSITTGKISNTVFTPYVNTGSFAALSGSFYSLSGNVTSLSGSYLYLSGRTTNSDTFLSGRIDFLSGNIVSITGDVDTLYNDLSYVSGQHNLLSGYVINLSGEVVSNSNSLSSHTSDTSIHYNQASISLVASQISDYKAALISGVTGYISLAEISGVQFSTPPDAGYNALIYNDGTSLWEPSRYVSDHVTAVDNPHSTTYSQVQAVYTGGYYATLTGTTKFLSGNYDSLSGTIAFVSGLVPAINNGIAFVSGQTLYLSGEHAYLSGNVGTLSGQFHTYTGRTIASNYFYANTFGTSAPATGIPLTAIKETVLYNSEDISIDPSGFGYTYITGLDVEGALISIDTALGNSSGGNTTMSYGAITTSTNSSTATWNSVGGSSVTVTAGNTYYIVFHLSTYSAANTTGLKVRRVLTTATGSIIFDVAYMMSNATATMSHSSREGTVDAHNGAGNATSSTTAKGLLTVQILFVCTGSGTLGLEMQTEVNTSLATIDGDGSGWIATAMTTPP